MKWAENNPVVSAFGIWNSDSGRRTIKFMHGTGGRRRRRDDDGCDDNDNEDDYDRQSFAESACYTESVVTVGSNFGYRNGMMGYQPSYHHHHHGSSSGSRMAFQHHHQHQYGKPKRRKHPEPYECERSSLDSIEVSASSRRGNTTITTTQQRQQQQQQSSNNNLLLYNKPAIEWDVFLDPILVRQVDSAMSIVDGLELKLRKVRMKREQRLRQRQQNDAMVMEGNTKDDHENCSTIIRRRRNVRVVLLLALLPMVQ